MMCSLEGGAIQKFRALQTQGRGDDEPRGELSVEF